MAIITTFENQCRALASASSPDENASRFLVGTLTPKQENLIYLFEYKDDNNNLAKIAFKFPYGEIWHLNTFSKYPKLVTGVTSLKEQLGISLFKLPTELDSPIEDDYGFSETPVEKVFELVKGDSKNLTRQCHWHPDDGDKLLTCNSGQLEFWDVNQQQLALRFSLNKVLEKLNNEKQSSQTPHVTDLRWSSLFNCSVVAAAIGSKVYGIDTRISDSSSTSVCWLIEDVRCDKIRSIDFNPNSQYYLTSGGDDCRANFWDLRHTSNPALYLQTHSHWIWSIRYNPYHDQLVLSAGSDARVALMRVQSIASEPFGQMTDYDDEDINSLNSDAGQDDEGCEKEQTTNNLMPCDNELSVSVKEDQVSSELSKSKEDRVIGVYEEHDDSVYSCEWATNPWIFASLGFESRLVINKVPKAEKFNILF